MRIVFVVGSFEIGGAERQLSCLARGLSERGHDVFVVTIFPGGQDESEISCKTLRIRPLIRKKSSWLLARLIQLICAPWKLGVLIREIRPDCVYSMLHLSNLYAWLATKGCYEVALVWGYRASRTQLNWRRLLPERICSHLSGTVPLVIANSHAGARYAREERGFHAKKMAVVPNGIDTNLFRLDKEGARSLRNELGIGDSTYAIGIVGRVDPVKGHECFLRAVEYVSVREPKSVFLIVGDGSVRRVDDLKKLAHVLGVSERVLWLGKRHDMPRVYSALDVFVSASRSEGFSNVVGEAMACQTPCVVTDVGDSAVIVGGLGCVVPPDDYQALGQSILKRISTSLNTDKEKLRERVEDNFSVNALLNETEALLIEVVSEFETRSDDSE